MSSTDVFKKVDNSLLDLQQSTLQSFEEPLRRLARLLDSEDLAAFNLTLIAKCDLDDFLLRSERTGGSMVGSHRLLWPEDPEEAMGLKLLLIKRFGDDPRFAIDFGHTYYYSGNKVISGVHSIVRQLLLPFIRDYKDLVMARGAAPTPRLMTPQSNRIFIVHGHDGESRETVARFLEKLGFEAVILHEQANQGRTIIEKVEANSDVGFAVVLLTPDDEGCRRGGTPEARVRQNVLLELGYFLGRLGRNRVCALKKGDVEIPSDFAGVVWEGMDSSAWKQSLGRELGAAGYQIDWNVVMR